MGFTVIERTETGALAGEEPVEAESLSEAMTFVEEAGLQHVIIADNETETVYTTHNRGQEWKRITAH